MFKYFHLKHVHLFEFNEQKWLPQFATSWMTSVLRVGHEGSEDGRVWAPKVKELLDKSGDSKIVDLCSGGAGPVLSMAEVLQNEYGIIPHITMTDLIPNMQAAKEINENRENCTYLTESVDATNVPRALKGVRTVFSGLHHLRPEVAFHFLKNAVDCRQHIFIGETTKRAYRSFRLYSAAIRWFYDVSDEMDLSNIQRFFSRKLPILPLMLGWDNVVSCLRTYGRYEIEAWFERLRTDDYCWETGELWNPMLKLPYPYIMGYPIRK